MYMCCMLAVDGACMYCALMTTSHLCYCPCMFALQKLSCTYFILPVDPRVFLVGICASPKTGKHSKAQASLNGEALRSVPFALRVCNKKEWVCL